jgi:S1-C subfamily serine protease
LLRGKPITIPSSTLLRIAEEISASGHVSQPYVGLVMQAVQIPESLQKKAGVAAAVGLLVMHVEPGGPADSGGVLLGDLLLEMDGRAFGELDDLSDAVRRKGPGQDVQTALIRGGQRLELTVRVGSRPSR